MNPHDFTRHDFVVSNARLNRLILKAIWNEAGRICADLSQISGMKNHAEVQRRQGEMMLLEHGGPAESWL